MLIESYIRTQLIQIIHSNEKNTIHKSAHRRSYILQQNYFTYQRKGNQELQIQALSDIVADLQNQINNFTFAGSDPNEPIIGII